MKRPARASSVVMAVLLLLAAAAAGGGEVLFHEAFTNLDNWQPLFFPKIPKHSTYEVIRDGEQTFLRAASNASASGIVFNREFDLRLHPRARWRWKVDNIYTQANETVRAGDDYPIRVYILFAYDPAKAGLAERIRYAAARLIYGEYPPRNSLNYVWASSEKGADFFPSPYAEPTVIVPRERGVARVGQWVDEEVDIAADYRRAFGGDPPATARLAVMNDSDDTGQSSVSYIAFIEIFR